MKQKNNILYDNKNDNFLSKFKFIYKFNNKWDTIFNFCIEYFNKNNYSKNIINIMKIIHNNKSFCAIFLLFISWFWSNLTLNFVYFFMLIDSLIVSLLVLQNNSIDTNSRRLSKNVILMFLISTNLIGSMFTLLMVIFIYMEYSKFVGRLIFKFIKFIIKIFGNIFPPIYLLYPDIKLFNFEDPDMTIKNNDKHINLYKKSSSSSNSSSSSDTDNSPNLKPKFKKINKKINSKLKYSKIAKKKLKNDLSFPSISTIKYDIFNDKMLNIHKK